MFYSALIMSGIFFTIASIFLVFKNKAWFLIGGYNCISKSQRKNYDEKRLIKDFRNNFYIYSTIWAFGAIGCILISDWCFFIAFIVWGIVFSKQGSLSYKLFDKYKIQDKP